MPESGGEDLVDEAVVVGDEEGVAGVTVTTGPSKRLRTWKDLRVRERETHFHRITSW